MVMRGTEIHDISQFKANFSIAELIQLYDCGELEIWLRNIGEKMLAEQVGRVKNNGYLLTELYKIFGLDPDMSEEQIRRSFGG